MVLLIGRGPARGQVGLWRRQPGSGAQPALANRVVHVAVPQAVLGCKTEPEKRRATREVILAKLEQFDEITRTRDRVFSDASRSDLLGVTVRAVWVDMSFGVFPFVWYGSQTL